MSTNQSNKEAWRKFLGIKDPSATLESGRVGGSIGRTAGRSGGGGGGGELDSDSVPEGENEDGAEKGDGAADFGDKLKPGDEFDRAEDLYDCETSEEVTLDGFGEKGSERYPTGFDDCKPNDVPDDFFSGYYFEAKGLISNSTGDTIIENPLKTFQRHSQAASYATNMADSYEYAPDGTISRVKSGELLDGGESISKNGESFYWGGAVYKTSCSVKFDQICNLPPPQSNWPAVDRNHLTWNKEKGCFEPL